MMYICAGCGEIFENAQKLTQHALICKELDGNR